MELPKLINNINERVVDDLKNRLSAKSKCLLLQHPSLYMLLKP